MPLKTLPYFHRVALRQRFADHLAQARDSLDDEEHRWLQGWLQAPGPDAPRIDRLSAITASAHASELTASLLLSRSTHPRVFFYHPLLGLLRFDRLGQPAAEVAPRLGRVDLVVAPAQEGIVIGAEAVAVFAVDADAVTA